MYGTHGTWCNTKTFPLKCRYCGGSIFFFQCDHESRVLFDALGWPWPLHDCLSPGPTSKPNPTNDSTYRALQRVQFTIRDEKTSGLIHGMRRFNASIDPAILSRVEQSQSTTRDTMRVDPIGGEETHIGTVSHIGEVSLESRYSVESDSIGARLISSTLGGLTVMQITILVDEFASDPDALDFMSYTFWCDPGLVPEILSTGDVVSATFAPAQMAGVGLRWVASSLEKLF